MQRNITAFTFTLPLRPTVHRNLRTHHPRYGYGCQPNRPSRINQYCFKHTKACASPSPSTSSPDVRIRRATQSDIPIVSRVLASAFSEDFLTQESTPVPVLTVLLPIYEFLTRLEVSNQLYRRVQNEKHALLLAEVDDKAVGCAEVGVLDIKTLTNGGDEVKGWGKGGSEAYIGNVGVLRRYRGRGVGRQLVQSAQSAAEEWGLGCVWLCVEARNDGAVRFYERLGFGCVAQEPDWFDEIGRRRRLFLCSSKGMDVGQWGKAKVIGGKLGMMQYLRYCLYDLRQRREAAEQDSGTSV